jgi:hypothetical protein
MELQGTIKKIGETEVLGAKNFKKRELIIIIGGDYPQVIMIEFVQDKCDLLNLFAEGQEVTIGINIRGKEWTNDKGESKYFNSIQGWKIGLTQL